MHILETHFRCPGFYIMINEMKKTLLGGGFILFLEMGISFWNTMGFLISEKDWVCDKKNLN